MVDEEKAVEDLARGLPFGEEIVSLARDFNGVNSLEARISRDADQLDLILELKQQQDLGNRYAQEWLSYAIERLLTPGAREMADEIMKTDSTEWWFEKKKELWVNGPENKKYAKR